MDSGDNKTIDYQTGETVFMARTYIPYGQESTPKITIYSSRVTKSGPKSVFIGGDERWGHERFDRGTQHFCPWKRTISEALEYARKKAHNDVERAQMELDRATAKMALLKSAKPEDFFSKAPE